MLGLEQGATGIRLMTTVTTRAGSPGAVLGEPVARVPSVKVRPPPPAGLRRDRLVRYLLDGPSGVRLLCAAAGSGKTTVLAHAVQAWQGSVVWVTVDGTDRASGRFAEVLGCAAGLEALPTGAGSSEAILNLIGFLEANTEPTLVVVDDIHELAGSPAADALDLLCRYRPRQATVILGARHLKGVDHWRWRSADDVRDLDGDGMRFRLWEIDSLFRDHYRAPLSTDVLHAIARFTDGWAVALHLFHIATRMLPAAERSRLVAGPRLTVRSVRDYLADEVLATVPADHRLLLRRIAVLDRIRPDRCDRLLGRRASAEQLHQFADTGLLMADADGVTYRLHELLRAQLLAELEEELGAEDLAGLHRRAAAMLEEDADVTEAVRALGRAGDWDGVRRLLATEGGPVCLPGAWVDDVPAPLRDTDPWVLRALARQQLGAGDFRAAHSTLVSSVERFRERGGDARTERDLHMLDGWRDPDPGQRRTWTECLRAGLAGQAVDAWPDEPAGWLAEGLTALAAGRLRSARDLLSRAAEALGGDLGTLAELGLSLVCALSDADPVTAAERALTRARTGGSRALVVAAESLAAYAAGGIVHAPTPAAGEPAQEPLGDGIHALLTGLALLRAGLAAAEPFRRAEARFGAAGLVVPGALAHAGAVLAAGSGPPDEDLVAARTAGPLPLAFALLAHGARTGDPSGEVQAQVLGRQHGFDLLLARLADVAAAHGPDRGRPVTERPAAGIDTRCLGVLDICVDGARCDLEQLRPRHQELLAIFAVHPNTWIHRERLFYWLWPDAAPAKAARNLQVAISAVRRLVDPDAPPGHSGVIVRSGERYRLVVDGDRSDLCRLEAAMGAAWEQLRIGEVMLAAKDLAGALAEWRGEPVPAVGPADWAVDRRRELSQAFSKVAVAVVEALRAADAVERAASLAAEAVRVDPADDRLWRLAIAAASEAGSAVLAADLGERYRALVDD